jgi:hypothetical protein
MRDTNSDEKLQRALALLRQRLGGRLWKLHLVFEGERVVLRGHALSYYAKQLAQHTIMEELGLPVLANMIEVQKQRPAPGLDPPDGG